MWEVYIPLRVPNLSHIPLLFLLFRRGPFLYSKKVEVKVELDLEGVPCRQPFGVLSLSGMCCNLQTPLFHL